MPPELATAAIAAGVALIVGALSALLTWTQIQRERHKWLTELKVAYALELYRTRLSSYPDVFVVLKKLSHGGQHVDSPVAPGTARQVGDELNDWIYSVGGMCADKVTRGALILLREACFQWAREGHPPNGVYSIRNSAIQALRLDLDLSGLEDYDFDNTPTQVEKLRQEIALMENRRGPGR
jgi:hypothetical protein